MEDTALRPETASKLLELVRVNVDSSKGFSKAAEVTENPALATIFREYARQRGRLGAELKAALGHQAAGEAGEGSLKARVHRWWMELRHRVSGGDEYAILAEVERAEDQIKAAYEEVILETVGGRVSDVLHSQLRAVAAGHDRIRALRDFAKS